MQKGRIGLTVSEDLFAYPFYLIARLLSNNP